MSEQHPEAIQTYEVFLEGGRALGTSEVTLPVLEHMTQDVTGAGINGTVNSPIKGHFASTNMTLTFRTVTDKTAKFLPQQAQHIELWASLQQYNRAAGMYEDIQHKIVTKSVLKNYTLGTLAVASLQGVALLFEILAMRSIINGVEEFEIDKYNGIYVVNGVNMMESIWRNVGLL
jgi:P2 family phage contractile tail tube protein